MHNGTNAYRDDYAVSPDSRSGGLWYKPVVNIAVENER